MRLVETGKMSAVVEFIERNWRNSRASSIVLRDIACTFTLLQKRLSQLEQAKHNESAYAQDAALSFEDKERLVDRVSEAMRDVAMIAAQIPVVHIGEIALKAQILQEFVGCEADDAADQLAASLCRDVARHTSK